MKTKRQAEKVGFGTLLCSEAKKCKNVLNEKETKITKQLHTLKSYSSSCKAKILNSFNPALQLKDTEYAIKNRLIGLLTELKFFKFVTTLL